jgi:cytochrome c-type biogenesis protein CcmF
LASFVLVANGGDFARGIRSYARANDVRLAAAIPEAVARNRRLYGGLVTHVGVAIAAIAITTSTAFAHQTEVTLSRAQRASFAGYSLRYEGLRVIPQRQRVVDVADVTVWRSGRYLGRLTPSLNNYPSAPNDPIGTPSIDYGVFKDLYSSLLGFGGGGDTATFRFFLNPGVMWLWIGGGIVALGGLLAAWPGRRRRVAEPAVARVPQLAGVG